jgi:hypothetical protein
MQDEVAQIAVTAKIRMFGLFRVFANNPLTPERFIRSPFALPRGRTVLFVYSSLIAHEDLHLLGWYWREVYHYAPLIVAQVVFVYVFDMLLCWVRHDKWTLGFGPSLSF